jgi:hypothetical protein
MKSAPGRSVVRISVARGVPESASLAAAVGSTGGRVGGGCWAGAGLVVAARAAVAAVVVRITKDFLAHQRQNGYPESDEHHLYVEVRIGQLRGGIRNQEDGAGEGVDSERGPDNGIQTFQRADGNRGSDAQQAEIDDANETRDHGHADSVDGENGRVGPDGARLQDPHAERQVF